MRFRDLVFQLRSSFSRKPDGVTRPVFDSVRPKFCIYGYATRGEARKKFGFAHYVWKYKILVPLLWLIEFCFGKRLERQIPEHGCYDDLRLFDRTFEDSIDFWTRKYLADPESDTYAEDVRKLRGSYSIKLLRTMKKVLVHMTTSDTAYFEFFNILLHKLAHAMYSEYKGRDVCHLFYTGKTIYDLSYARLYPKLKKLKLIDSENLDALMSEFGIKGEKDG